VTFCEIGHGSLAASLTFLSRGERISPDVERMSGTGHPSNFRES